MTHKQVAESVELQRFMEYLVKGIMALKDMQCEKREDLDIFHVGSQG